MINEKMTRTVIFPAVNTTSGAIYYFSFLQLVFVRLEGSPLQCQRVLFCETASVLSISRNRHTFF